MNIELWSLGRENTKLVDPAIEEYSKRLKRYISFQMVTLDNTRIPKTLPMLSLLEKEADLVLDKLQERDLLVVLDENGKNFTSRAFSQQLNQFMNQSPQRLVFLIGGSYGIAPRVKSRANLLLALSAFTFPHQLVRLLFAEQLYRAFTILKNEKYHHD